MTRVNDTVAEILHTAKDEVVPAAELSKDLQIMQEEVEVSTETPSEADDTETEEDDGIDMFFLVAFICQTPDC